MKLTLETRDETDRTVNIGALSMTPMVSEDYWHYRVQLSDKQAIVGFPKFGTIGIGFAVEEDWNTNLPFSRSAQEIFEHISHNKGDDSIPDEACKSAIQLIKEQVVVDALSVPKLRAEVQRLRGLLAGAS